MSGCLMIYSWLHTSECNILNEVLEHTFCCSKIWWTAARIGGLYWWIVARLSRHTSCLKWRADPMKLVDHSSFVVWQVLCSGPGA